MDSNTNMMNGSGFDKSMIWVGVAIGAAIGVGYAVTHRKKDAWSTAKDIRKRAQSHTSDLVDRGKDMADRARVIYEEGRKLVEEAAELWTHGRRIVGY